MVDNNALLQYKDEHFGKFILYKPNSFIELKKLNELGYTARFPYDFYHMPFGGNYKNISYDQPDFNANSFYEKRFLDVCGPKKLSIIKNNEHVITHKLSNFTKVFYELVCIFPQDVQVPGYLRVFNYYGSPDWFEPFVAKEDEFQQILKAAKTALMNKNS